MRRGHPLRQEERRFHHRRQGFFTVRAVRLWNSLPRCSSGGGFIVQGQEGPEGPDLVS